MITLRPYQAEAEKAITEELRQVKSTLAVLPTGTGKTIIFAKIADKFCDRGRVLILAHRAELIFQAVERLHASADLKADIEMAELYADQGGFFTSPVIVSTVQTQIAGVNGHRRMYKFDPDRFSLLIVDEAHHAAAASYRKIIEYYRHNSDLRVLGVTATPDRADEKALGEVFETCAYEYGMIDAINDGWLVPIHQQFVECADLDFSSCRTTAGDLNGADLAAVMEYEKALQQVTGPTLEIVGDKRCLIFAASVAHADRMCEIINRHHPGSAFIVTAGTDKNDRAGMIQKYKEGRYQFMVNVGIATEGFDVPGIEVIVQARPTKSRALYSQMIGRGTRPIAGLVDGIPDAVDRRNAIAASSKPKLLVLDFVGNSGRHKLVSTLDILGGNYDEEVAELAERTLRTSGKPDDAQEALRKAEREAARRRAALEAKHRSHLKARTKHRAQVVDPFEVLDIVPWRERAWDKSAPATEKQAALLTKFGVQDAETFDKRRASQLIGELIERRKQGACTFKQARLLKRYGYDPTDISFKEARGIIDELAKNWRRR